MAIPTLNEVVYGQGGIFVPDELSTELNMLLRDASQVEAFARHIPMRRHTMTRRKQADGVLGYWVDAMNVKPKDAPTFESYTLTAEKMAVIVPVEDQLIEDADTDIANVIRTDVTGAFAELLDRTYMGYEATTPFAQSVSGTCPAAHSIAFGTGVDLAEDINLAIEQVEAHGWAPTGMIAHPRTKARLRGLRDLLNTPIFAENLRDGIREFSVFGIPMRFTRQVQEAGAPPASEILMAYWPYVMIGDRTGANSIQVSVSDEATLTQGTDEPLNLWEMDLTAFRFVIRKAFVVKDENCLAKVTGVHA